MIWESQENSSNFFFFFIQLLKVIFDQIFSCLHLPMTWINWSASPHRGLSIKNTSWEQSVLDIEYKSWEGRGNNWNQKFQIYSFSDQSSFPAFSSCLLTSPGCHGNISLWWWQQHFGQKASQATMVTPKTVKLPSLLEGWGRNGRGSWAKQATGIASGKPGSDLNLEGINLTQQIWNMYKDNNNENETSMIDFIKI